MDKEIDEEGEINIESLYQVMLIDHIPLTLSLSLAIDRYRLSFLARLLLEVFHCLANTQEFVFTSPAVTSVSCSLYLDGL